MGSNTLMRHAAFVCAVTVACAVAAFPQAAESLEQKRQRAEIEKLQLEIDTLKRAATKDDLESQRLAAELEKVRNENSRFPGLTLALVQALGLGGIFAGFLALLAGKKLQDAQLQRLQQEKNFTEENHELQREKLVQELEISRRAHDLDNFKALGDDDPRVRIGAVSVLAQRVRELTARNERSALEKQQTDTIVRLLIAVTKHEDREEIQKYIADQLVSVLGAHAQNAGELAPASPLAPYDCQGARFTNAWWQSVDLRGVDFYKAQLPRAGLAGSYLQSAVFKNADLNGASLSNAAAGPAHVENTNFEGASMKAVRGRGLQLRGAVLSGADLSNSDLRGADFRGAKLERVILSGARLEGANLRGTDLSSARLDSAVLDGVESDENTIFPWSGTTRPGG